MSPNKNKIRGSNWERELVEILNSSVQHGKFKRVPGSGAIGTFLGEAILTGDINGEVLGFPKKFKIEAKCGYGKKEMTLKKEWLDKIRVEADNAYSIPILFGKFSDVRGGVKHFAVIDLETFILFMNIVSSLKDSVDTAYKELQELRKK